MRIDKLIVQNFCCFERDEFTFSPHFNLVVGDNATGKSSLLNALAVGIGTFLLGNSESKDRGIQKSEVRFSKAFDPTSLSLKTEHLPVAVQCEGVVNNDKGTWRRDLRSMKGNTTRVDAKFITEKVAEIRQDILARIAYRKQLNDTSKAQSNAEPEDSNSIYPKRDQQKSTPPPTPALPLLAYYGTQRLWLTKKLTRQLPVDSIKRDIGYRDALDPASNHRHLMAWMEKMTYAELQANQESIKKVTFPALQAVKNSIVSCLPEVSIVSYDIRWNELVIEKDDNQRLPFSALSDGYRNALALVADLAWRAVVLNPHWGAHAPQSVEGVVLIDELDLHLHPKWQRRVATDLRKTFPKLQFIATSHSPFIIQNLPKGASIINLDDGDGVLSDEPGNLSPEDIVEEVQGVEMPQRSKRREAMAQAAEAYYRALDRVPAAPEEEIQALEDELNRLSEPFSDDPAFMAVLKVERERAYNERRSGS